MDKETVLEIVDQFRSFVDRLEDKYNAGIKRAHERIDGLVTELAGMKGKIDSIDANILNLNKNIEDQNKNMWRLTFALVVIFAAIVFAALPSTGKIIQHALGILK